jgi:hypothetical protein
MPSISIRAHFDGHAIQLDEPFPLPRNAQLLVTVLSPETIDPEMAAWAEVAASGLARAYGEVEPEYSSADIVP